MVAVVGGAVVGGEIVGAVPVGDRAAAIAAVAAGLEAMAVSSSGDNVVRLVVVSTGVVGADTTGRPEWSMEVSGQQASPPWACLPLPSVDTGSKREERCKI